MHSVYGLCDPRTGDIRYIGQAIDVYKRYAQHLLYEEYNRAKRAWINELKALDKLPVLIILEKGIADEHILAREMYWIAYYLLRKADLLNIVVPGRAPNRRGTPNPHKAINATPVAKVSPIHKTPVENTSVERIGPAILEESEIEELKVYTIEDLAKRFMVKENVFIRYIQRGEMNASMSKDGWVVTESDLSSWLQLARQKAEEELDQRIRRRQERRQQSAG